MVRRPLALSLLLALAPGAVATRAEAFGEPRAKVNVVDATNAPEMWVYTTLLDAKDRPVPPSKVLGVEVWMNGRKVAANPQPPPIKDTDQALALALVLCGTQSCRRIKKAQTKGMGALGAVARKIDQGTVWVYENNVRNVSGGKWVPLGDATGGLAAARVSATAYKSKWLAAVHDAVRMFGAHHKKLPANRAVVVLSDGLDGRDPTGGSSEGRIKRIVDDARKWQVRVMSVGYSADTDIGLSNLQLLSRKTGGTYRRAFRPSEIPILLKEVAAELFYQHAIFTAPKVKAKRTYNFSVAMLHRGKRVVTPRKPAYEVHVKETFFRWAYWGRIALIVGAIILVIVLIALLVLFLRRRKRKKAEMEKAYKQAMGEDDDDLDDDVEDALEDADEALEHADDGPKGALCPSCGRVMLEDWAECLFCARGVGGPVGGGD